MVKKGFMASFLFGLAAGVYAMTEATATNVPHSFEFALLVGICAFGFAWTIIFTIALLYTVLDVYPKKLDRIADEIKYLNRRNTVDNDTEE